MNYCIAALILGTAFVVYSAGFVCGMRAALLKQRNDEKPSIVDDDTEAGVTL